jgi:hypothetical protein
LEIQLQDPCNACQSMWRPSGSFDSFCYNETTCPCWWVTASQPLILFVRCKYSGLHTLLHTLKSRQSDVAPWDLLTCSTGWSLHVCETRRDHSECCQLVAHGLNSSLLSRRHSETAGPRQRRAREPHPIRAEIILYALDRQCHRTTYKIHHYKYPSS